MSETATGDNAKYLTKEFVESKVFEIMAPLLPFEGVIKEIKIDSRSAIYKQEAASHGSDSNKKKPRTRTESSKWTYVNVESVNVLSAVLNTKGFAIRVDRDAIRFTEGVDEIDRAFNRVAYWLAQDVNDEIISTINSNATGPTTKLGSPTAWSASGASPIKDLMRVSQDMRQEGYPYRVTDVYLHDDNWYELQEYVTFLDNRNIGFTPSIGDDNNNNLMKINKLPGMDIHGLLSSVTESNITALDRNNSPGVQYYTIDPKYAVVRPNNSVSPLQINTYTDNETHDEIIQIWKDYTVAIKEPKAAIFAESKI